MRMRMRLRWIEVVPNTYPPDRLFFVILDSLDGEEEGGEGEQLAGLTQPGSLARAFARRRLAHWLGCGCLSRLRPCCSTRWQPGRGAEHEIPKPLSAPLRGTAGGLSTGVSRRQPSRGPRPTRRPAKVRRLCSKAARSGRPWLAIWPREGARPRSCVYT